MPKPEKFEASVKKLESVVTRLEEGNLPLEESLRIFEEGVRLVRACQERLTEAKKKVEVFLKGGKRVPFES